MKQLLSRDEFREQVFARDSHKCVICGQSAKDAHHIMERRLFSDGGYYLDNGASLCEEHHIQAEETTLSCEEIRERASIKNIILPDHLYDDYEYDKWGNILLPNGNRIKGELFYDESVQKILKQGNVLDHFQKYVKYPRTYHLPWSILTKGDRKMHDDSNLIGKEVVGTLKMDGENTTMYRDYMHARSLDYTSHESRHYVKGLWANVSYNIDDNMRVCGENLYAKHSIYYLDLKDYFQVFSIWIDNTCVSWHETKELATILGLNTVPVIFMGIYDPDAIIRAFEPYQHHEGYVVRLAGEFDYRDFRRSVGKFVHPKFKQKVNDAHGHWISDRVVPNILTPIGNE